MQIASESRSIGSPEDRVRLNTSRRINDRIDAQMRQRVQQLAIQGNHAISQRLDELDREWDIERVLEANASSLVLGSVALGVFVDKRWFLLTGIVAGFLLNHSIQGWCPPVPIFRRMGIRTRHEIEQERYALQTLRGDFGDTSGWKNHGPHDRPIEKSATIPPVPVSEPVTS